MRRMARIPSRIQFAKGNSVKGNAPDSFQRQDPLKGHRRFSENRHMISHACQAPLVESGEVGLGERNGLTLKDAHEKFGLRRALAIKTDGCPLPSPYLDTQKKKKKKKEKKKRNQWRTKKKKPQPEKKKTTTKKKKKKKKNKSDGSASQHTTKKKKKKKTNMNSKNKFGISSVQALFPLDLGQILLLPGAPRQEGVDNLGGRVESRVGGKSRGSEKGRVECANHRRWKDDCKWCRRKGGVRG